MSTMFESIKAALNKKNSGRNGQGDILRLEIGNTYELKLLPNPKEPGKTFFHYYMHGWESFATGQYVSIISPTTFNERDPISEERFKILKLGSEAEKAKINKVRRGEKWFVNVYVVKDPVNPENEGKVKILRYGKQLDSIIMDAIEGADAEEFGEKVFDMNPGGAIFKVKVDKQQDFPSYTASRFTNSSKWFLPVDKQNEVLDNLHDITAIYDQKTFEETRNFFHTHYNVDAAPSKSDNKSDNKQDVNNQSDDDIIAELSGSGAGPVEPKETDVSNHEFDSSGDAEIDDILNDI